MTDFGMLTINNVEEVASRLTNKRLWFSMDVNKRRRPPTIEKDTRQHSYVCGIAGYVGTFLPSIRVASRGQPATPQVREFFYSL